MTFGPVGYLIYVCYFHYKLWMELMYLLFFLLLFFLLQGSVSLAEDPAHLFHSFQCK